MSVRSNTTARRPGGAGRRRMLLHAAAWVVLAQAPYARAADPAPPPELKPPAKSTLMPAFELPTTSGATLRSQSLKGQVLVIRFWASW
jgi:hypothetical protein